MAKIEDGGAAFARSGSWNASGSMASPSDKGMSLRDWFAGQAFAAAMTNATGLGHLEATQRKELFSGLAAIVYEGADAMLAARDAQ